MKRILIVSVILVYAAILVSCGGKSAEVRNVERLIAEIGEVTADSGDAIARAEEAYEALSKNDQNQVSHVNDLFKARSTLRVKEVEAAIDTIKNVTVNSRHKIEKIEQMYDSLSDEEKTSVENYGKLEQARSDYETALLDSYEKEPTLDATRGVLSQMASAAGYSEPEYTLNRSERTYYCRILVPDDSPLAVASNPSARGFLNQVASSYGEICKYMYEFSKSYRVDVILRLMTSYGGKIFEIKNGEITYTRG